MINEKILIQKNADSALKDDKGHSLTYGELRDFCRGFIDYFSVKSRELVFVLCENSVPCAAFFCGCIEAGVIPLLLNGVIDRDMLKRYIALYEPNYIFKPKYMNADCEGSYIRDYYDYELVRINDKKAYFYDELSFLLPTSGTTGNPKLVRHSYVNLHTNAENVAKAFGLNGNDYAMLNLPIHFTQGLSVLYSHLYAGARIFLTDALLNSREFWNFMKNEEITSFTGVPYSYEILDKLRFYTMKLPALNVISQGGGRMPDELFVRLSAYAENTGRKFYATYGATETTARMSCLSPEYASQKRGSIGKPLPGYEMWLVNEAGEEITEHNKPGELIFKGGSVTLGYAESAEDLRKGDERNGVYRTGDLAYRDQDGFYYITGRLSRFLKIFGYRINMDETERLVKSKFEGGIACAGKDEKLYIFTSNKNIDTNEITIFLKNKLKINISAFEAVYIEEIPKKPNGKTDYVQLGKMIELRKECI